MSEPNNMRWQFRVIDLPKPIRSGTTYRFLFVGMGFATGAVWENFMVDWLGHLRGVRVVYSIVALIFAYQGFFLWREEKRLKKMTEEMRAWANREIGPEVKDGAGESPVHSDEPRA